MNPLPLTFPIIVAIILACLILACLLDDRRRRQSFNERWPPISDDQFFAKCSPGTSRDSAIRVRHIIAEQFGVPYERIHPDQNLVRDLGG